MPVETGNCTDPALTCPCSLAALGHLGLAPQAPELLGEVTEAGAFRIVLGGSSCKGKGLQHSLLIGSRIYQLPVTKH